MCPSQASGCIRNNVVLPSRIVALVYPDNAPPVLVAYLASKRHPLTRVLCPSLARYFGCAPSLRRKFGDISPFRVRQASGLTSAPNRHSVSASSCFVVCERACMIEPRRAQRYAVTKCSLLSTYDKAKYRGKQVCLCPIRTSTAGNGALSRSSLLGCFNRHSRAIHAAIMPCHLSIPRVASLYHLSYHYDTPSCCFTR